MTKHTVLRIGSRKSALAIKQAEIVGQKLQESFPEIQLEYLTFQTTGDILYQENLASIGGKGLFLKELEEALLAKKIDVAVHSMKDMPADLMPGLTFSCVLKREDPRDVLISKHNLPLMDLPGDAIIGTCSARRALQLHLLRPDIRIEPIRGNIQTRINKMHESHLSAIVLAGAGLKRLGMQSQITQIFEAEEMIPAICQGIICVEHLEDSAHVKEILAAINDSNTMACAIAERTVMKELSGDCKTPIAAYAVLEADGSMYMNAMYSGPLTKHTISKASVSGYSSDPIALGVKAVKSLKEFKL